MVAFEEYVIGLDVSVKDVVLTELLHGIDELSKYLQGLSFLNGFPLLDVLLKSTTFAVFINQVDVPIGFDHLNKFDNVNVIAKKLNGLNLIFGEFCQFLDFYEFGEGDHFNGHFYLSLQICGLIHLPILPFTEVVRQGIVIDKLQHYLFQIIVLIAEVCYVLLIMDEENKYQNSKIIIGKKSNKIDEQENRQKGKKSKKRKVDEPVVIQPRKQVMNLTQQQKNSMIQEVCDILENNYQEKTIRKVLEDCQYKREEAFDIIYSLKPDNQQQSEFDNAFDNNETTKLKGHQQASEMSKSQSEQKSTSSEIANNLMSEFYDNLDGEDMELNGKQFEELFAQITEMINRDQKQHGKTVFEINSLVDECNGVKHTLMVGFKEEFNNFEDYIDSYEDNPLYEQTQAFLLERIVKEQEVEKRNEEDFPTLGGGGSSVKKAKKTTIIDMIHQQNKNQSLKKVEEGFFFPSKRQVMPQFAKQKSKQHTIFNIDNQLKSEQDIRSLNKQFGKVPIMHLKFIYKTLGYDYNLCIQFLNKYYKQKRTGKVYEKYSAIREPKSKMPRKHTNLMKREEIDKELKSYSYEMLRQEVNHLYMLKHTFNITKLKIKSQSQRQELDRISKQNNPLIDKLSKASKILLINQMAARHPLYVDLHGYREEEVDPIMEAICDMLKDEFHCGNEKVKTRKVNGRYDCCLIVMTGKGLHSKGMRSVLKPALQKWCENNGVGWEEQEDHIKAYIPL